MEYVTIRESQSLSDLLVLKSRIESEGIECRLKDELSSQVLNYLPIMTVKLQVLSKDLKDVKKIMEASGETVFINREITCPVCNSAQVKAKLSLKNILRVFSNFLLSAATFSTGGNIFKSAEFKCQSCQTVFKADR